MCKCGPLIGHWLALMGGVVVTYLVYLKVLLWTLGGDSILYGDHRLVSWTSAGGEVGHGVVRAWAFFGALVTVLILGAAAARHAAAPKVQ